MSDNPFGDDDNKPRPDDQPLNFFDELEELADRSPFEPFLVILISGDHLRVEESGQLLVLEQMYVFSPRGGGSTMFPFPNVCAVQTLDNPD